MSNFAQWQREYAAHGLPTFPVSIVDGGKRPMVRNYLRIGAPASDELAKKYPAAEAFGFAVGKRSNITVLDIDSNDERILSDAMSRHGATPLVVRSGSGHFQAWYRHNGERRKIRPDVSRPIDILGGGFVVAPPSRGTKSRYQIIGGSLDDLTRLPTLQNFKAAVADQKCTDVVPHGVRNVALWRHCMHHARACDDFEAVLDVAETFAAQCEETATDPLTVEEVRKTAKSAWGYTQRGANWIGARHLQFNSATFPPSELSRDPYLFTLLSWLRDHDGPARTLMIADGLHKVLNWSEHQVREARRRAISGEWVVMTEPPSRNRAARFAWGPASLRHGVWITEAMPSGLPKGERGGGESVYSHVWNPEAISPAVRSGVAA